MSAVRFLAVIPARGGSKGLPNKNILPLLGKPLIAWSIAASMSSDYTIDTIVSSDSEEILQVATEYGATPLLRPKTLAQDTTPSEPVLTHACASMPKHYDYLILLQPTSPLRNFEHLNEAIALLLATGSTSLISVYEPSHHPLKAFTLTENNKLKGLVNDQYPFMRRQDLPRAFYPNGAIYIVQTDFFLRNEKLFSEGDTVPYIMDEMHSIDIDSMEDLKAAENYLKKISST